MDVSILICTHNSNAKLGRCLQHLANQKTGGKVSWEILICDYISDDGTAETVQYYAENYPNLKFNFIQVKEAGKTPHCSLDLMLRRVRLFALLMMIILLMSHM